MTTKNSALTRMLYRIIMKKAKTFDKNSALKALVWRPLELKTSTNDSDRELDALYGRLLGTNKGVTFVPRYARSFVETEGTDTDWRSFQDFVKAEFRRPSRSDEDSELRLNAALYSIKELNRCSQTFNLLEQIPSEKTNIRVLSKDDSKGAKQLRKTMSSLPTDPNIVFEKEIPPNFTFETQKKYYLVSHPLILDHRFKSTLIVLTQNDASGSTGLAVNLPTNSPLKQHHPRAPKMWRSHTVYAGGPVGSTISSIKRFNVPYSDDPEQVRPESNDERKFFQGKCVWGPGQLETEIERGQWLLVSATEDLIFTNFYSSAKRSAVSRQREAFWRFVIANCPGEIAGWQTLSIDAPLVPRTIEEEEDEDIFEDDDEEEEV
eukprot:TRINITY_DN7948_c0_g4_i1.p1 TRINITY_DN7948_c0_g4~~TRINITY_DN7948_c0_g4_i1.p1  ORF type:complete len:389 (-),score=117.71 TRINITY_DN7948_c0_g4_i1:15-1145(-)